MSKARRAATETPDVTTVTVSPRRGQTSAFGPAVRRAIAPTAIVGLLLATTTLTFVPMGPTDTTSVADPLAAHDARVANRASREFARIPVPFPTPVDASPSAAPTPSISASPSAVASESPAVEAAPASAASTPAETTPPAPVETVAETPAVDWSAEGKDVGSRWSTASVNVRKGPGKDHDVVTTFGEGSKTTITDKHHDGWQQVSLKNGAGWVKASFLTEDEPVKATKAASASSPAASSSSAAASSPASSSSSTSSAGRCAKAGNATNGMTSRTVNVLNQVCANFSSISSYGGYRAGSSGYHGSGQAIDAMVSGEAGWEVARWVRDNASSLGVVEVIYSQKIWTKQRSGDGWRSMSSRGNATANHFDHVHISVG